MNGLCLRARCLALHIRETWCLRETWIHAMGRNSCQGTGREGGRDSEGAWGGKDERHRLWGWHVLHEGGFPKPGFGFCNGRVILSIASNQSEIAGIPVQITVERRATRSHLIGRRGRAGTSLRDRRYSFRDRFVCACAARCCLPSADTPTVCHRQPAVGRLH